MEIVTMFPCVKGMTCDCCSMQANMEFGKSSRAALAIVLLQIVLFRAESQAQLIIGKYCLDF